MIINLWLEKDVENNIRLNNIISIFISPESSALFYILNLNFVIYKSFM